MTEKNNFLEAMWKKVEEKETDIQIFEAVSKGKTGASMLVFFRDLISPAGIHGIFAGMADVICIAFIVTVICFWLGYQLIFQEESNVYSVVFLCAPVFYGAVFWLAWLKESQRNTYSILMSCKYTFFHLLAFRMLITSLAGILANSVYLGILMIWFPASGFRLFAVSFSSLMIFSAILVVCLTKIPGRKGKQAIAVASTLWFSVNLFCYWNFSEHYARILQEIPIYLLIGVMVITIAVYLNGLFHMTTVRFRKEYADAAN